MGEKGCAKVYEVGGGLRRTLHMMYTKYEIALIPNNTLVHHHHLRWWTQL